METQDGGGDIYSNGVNPHIPLSNNHRTTPGLLETERVFEIEHSFTNDQNQAVNESVQNEVNDTASRRKGKWSVEEDRKFLSLVNKHGEGKWTRIAQEMDSRNARQCSARWKNHLRPDIKKDIWSLEEEKAFIQVHEIVGNKWVEVAKRIPGRSENSIKNHWYATKRKLMRMKTNKASVLQDYINTKILHHNCNNSTTASLSTKFTSDDHSSNREIS